MKIFENQQFLLRQVYVAPTEKPCSRSLHSLVFPIPMLFEIQKVILMHYCDSVLTMWHCHLKFNTNFWKNPYKKKGIWSGNLKTEFISLVMDQIILAVKEVTVWTDTLSISEGFPSPHPNSCYYWSAPDFSYMIHKITVLIHSHFSGSFCFISAPCARPLWAPHVRQS